MHDYISVDPKVETCQSKGLIFRDCRELGHVLSLQICEGTKTLYEKRFIPVLKGVVNFLLFKKNKKMNLKKDTVHISKKITGMAD